MSDFNLHDYIAPGEFTYCARGEHLVLDPRTQCRACFDFGNQTSLPGREEAVSEHSRLLQLRQMLAESRKAAGIPPQFWLGVKARRDEIRALGVELDKWYALPDFRYVPGSKDYLIRRGRVILNSLGVSWIRVQQRWLSESDKAGDDPFDDHDTTEQEHEFTSAAQARALLFGLGLIIRKEDQT